MSYIIAKNEKEVIKALKKNKERVFRVTKEIIYALPSCYTTQFPSSKCLQKYVDKHPEKVFIDYYYVMETVKKIKEL